MTHGAPILTAFALLFGLAALASYGPFRAALMCRLGTLSPIWWLVLGGAIVRFGGDVGSLVLLGAFGTYAVATIVGMRVRKRVHDGPHITRPTRPAPPPPRKPLARLDVRIGGRPLPSADVLFRATDADWSADAETPTSPRGAR